jgi:hypothetical protein
MAKATGLRRILLRSRLNIASAFFKALHSQGTKIDQIIVKALRQIAIHPEDG